MSVKKKDSSVPDPENKVVNWREKVLPEYLYVNKEWFTNKSLAVPDSIDGLKDNQLVINLGGLKFLLRERGFRSCKTKVKNVGDNYVVAKCEIIFSENEHGPETLYTANASATINNTDSFGLRYLEATAENRAFARCIRNFLNINIVSDEELTREPLQPMVQTQSQSQSKGFTPQGLLQNLVEEKFGINSFVPFKQTKIKELFSSGAFKADVNDINSWKEYEHIPAKEARILLGLIKNL